MRKCDVKEREREILSLIIDSYIKESKPISSSYLCQKYHLPYSSATVRNTMESLEDKGMIFHTHTSSGRVPTKDAFKQYVDTVTEQDINTDGFNDLELALPNISDMVNFTDYILDVLTKYSGYMSLVAVADRENMFISKRMRFILEQPEFEDINRLKSLFYILEVKSTQLQDLLFNSIDNKIKILVADEIGFSEIEDCSLVVSGVKKQDISLALALLGPVRMDYTRAASLVYSMRNKLEIVLESL